MPAADRIQFLKRAPRCFHGGIRRRQDRNKFRARLTRVFESVRVWPVKSRSQTLTLLSRRIFASSRCRLVCPWFARLTHQSSEAKTRSKVGAADIDVAGQKQYAGWMAGLPISGVAL